jgi:hypothetical protein
MWYISLILVIFAGIMNSIMDVLRYRWSICIFKDWKAQNWINPGISWHTKWEIDQKLFGKEVKIVDLFMSTCLVWITDLWHFSKMLMLLAISAAIVFYSPIFEWYFDIPILYFAFTAVFELFFSKIWIKSKK